MGKKTFGIGKSPFLIDKSHLNHLLSRNKTGWFPFRVNSTDRRIGSFFSSTFGRPIWELDEKPQGFSSIGHRAGNVHLQPDVAWMGVTSWASKDGTVNKPRDPRDSSLKRFWRHWNERNQDNYKTWRHYRAEIGVNYSVNMVVLRTNRDTSTQSQSQNTMLSICQRSWMILLWCTKKTWWHQHFCDRSSSSSSSALGHTPTTPGHPAPQFRSSLQIFLRKGKWDEMGGKQSMYLAQFLVARSKKKSCYFGAYLRRGFKMFPYGWWHVVTTKHQPDKGPEDLIPFGLIEPRTLVEHGLFLDKSFEQSDILRIRFKWTQ